MDKLEVILKHISVKTYIFLFNCLNPVDTSAFLSLGEKKGPHPYSSLGPISWEYLGLLTTVWLWPWLHSWIDCFLWFAFWMAGILELLSMKAWFALGFTSWIRLLNSEAQIYSQRAFLIPIPVCAESVPRRGFSYTPSLSPLDHEIRHWRAQSSGICFPDWPWILESWAGAELGILGWGRANFSLGHPE